MLVSYSGHPSHAARLYAAGHDMRDPQLSPIYGDLSGFPPAILISGTRDRLLSNIVRTHRKLRRAGVDAVLNVYESCPTRSTCSTRQRRKRGRCSGGAAFFDKHLAP